MRFATRRRREEEEAESAFVSMTDMTVSFLFIVMILLAFFASQYNDKEVVPRPVHETVVQERDSARQDVERLLLSIARLQAQIEDLKQTVATKDARIAELERQLAEALEKLKQRDPLEAYSARSTKARHEMIERLVAAVKEDIAREKIEGLDVSAQGDALRFQGSGLFASGQGGLSGNSLRIIRLLGAHLEGQLPCLPALALRRMKDKVARDLPAKTRVLVPREMPALQAQVYDAARLQLASGTPGAALKLLHHIRTVSVHPALGSLSADAEFIAASARLSATFDILRQIRARRERALVFIENRQMQYRFIEIARAEFGLNRIDLINGDTPIAQRQQIVNRFQAHLEEGGGFDLLVLGPKAAGTGLTLTAATHVIHLSRWWNPAVEEQCNDRVHRLGQTRPVQIHVPMAIHPGYRAHSFDCLLHTLMQRKRRMASAALWPMGDTDTDAQQLQGMVAQEALGPEDLGQGRGQIVTQAMVETFAREGVACPEPGEGGGYAFE